MCANTSVRSLARRQRLAWPLALLIAFLLALPASAQPALPPEDLNDIERETLAELYSEGQVIAPATRWQLLRPDIITYTIQPGDNDWSIARRFGLDIDSLRFANEWMRRNPDLIHPGDQLVILPVKGAYHTVQAGDTVESIAAAYGVPAADIVDFPLNQLAGRSVVRPGQKLIIPGGRLDYAERILAPGPGRGYALAWPLRGYLTQGYHAAHTAVDIASAYGAKVYASRGGVVTNAWFSPGGWLGFTVTISHDNGLVTRYSHLSGIYVEPGQVVARGEIIGQLGSTGNSTGPHVHFEVWKDKAKVNPLSVLPPSAAD